MGHPVGATRTVPDGAGGGSLSPAGPGTSHGAAKPDETTGATDAADAGLQPERRRPARASHNEEVLRELGYTDDQITRLTNAAY